MLSWLGFRRLSTSKIHPFLSFQIARSISSNRHTLQSSVLEGLILRQHCNGKFRNIFRTAISDHFFLFAACQSLCPDKAPPSPDSINRFVSIEGLSLDIRSGLFDVESSCVKLLPSRTKGPHLVLPNLKLKVVIEAVRIALEIVYEKRLSTFAYGGRVGMGCHTAARYLKTTVENPNWWFRLSLRRQSMNLNRLKTVLSEKIEDDALVGFIDRLFASEAVVIDLGGLDLGRGFPQESRLSSILVNIYFDGLDQEIKEIRAQIHRRNPRLKNLENNEMDPRVFHKPLRVYAVRYLDEVLIATSGSKLTIIDLRDRILNYVEGFMSLKVDKLKTSVHSAVSEKMNFIGMELQAVTPSVLNPPLSEKAMRAKKKHLKQKAAKVLELKNARETRRKKLGLRILKCIFKRLKLDGGFNIGVPVETEVRVLFRTWAEEVVAEYLTLNQECYLWHKMFSSGDFLSLKRVRDQLPESLVDAYDQFQGKLNKYLVPMRTRKQLNESEMEEEAEEKRYSKRIVEDLTELVVRVSTPIELVRRAVRLARFTNSMGRPRPIKLLICLDDSDIIKWYAGVAWRWLDFYCCCRNFKRVKTIVSYHLRFSCFLTLAEKHELTKKQAIKRYTKDLKFVGANGEEEVCFPTEKEIRMMGKRNLSDPKPVDGAISMILVRLAFNEHSSVCLAHFCESTATILYRVRLLQNRLNVDPLNEQKWVPGMGAIHEALNRKCLPLCPKHATALFLGKICLQDIDCTSFLNID